jgi:Spy/CpxP family protein refolding chaperone
MKYLAILALCFATTAALAQPGGFGGGPGGKLAGSFGKGQFIKELNLNDQQKEAVKAFRKEKAEVEKLSIDLRSEQEELREAAKDPKSDDKALLAMVERVNKLQGDINLRKIKNFISLRKSLSPEQLSQIIEKRDELRENMRERFRERMMGGEGMRREGRPPMGQRPSMDAGEQEGVSRDASRDELGL